MTKENQDFEMYAGDYREIVGTVTNPDGSAKDISGFDAQVTVSDFDGGPTVIQYDEADSRFSISDGPAGECRAELTPADTEPLADSVPETYYYEIELDNGSTPHTVTQGTILVKPSY